MAAAASEPLRLLPSTYFAKSSPDALIEMPGGAGAKGGVVEQLGLGQYAGDRHFVPRLGDEKSCFRELAAKINFRQRIISSVRGLDNDMYAEGSAGDFKDIALVVSRNRPHPVDAPTAEVAARWEAANGHRFRLAVFRTDDILDAFLCENLEAADPAPSTGAAAAISRIGQALENGMQYVRRIYLYTASYTGAEPHLPSMFYDVTLRSQTFLHSITCTLANQPLYANKIYIDTMYSDEQAPGVIPQYMNTVAVRLNAPYDRGERDYYVSWFDLKTSRVSHRMTKPSKAVYTRAGRAHFLEDIAKVSKTRGHGVYGFNSSWLEPGLALLPKDSTQFDRYREKRAASDPNFSINVLALQPIFRDMFPLIFPFQLFSPKFRREVQPPYVHFLNLAAGLPDLQVPGAFLYVNPATQIRPPAGTAPAMRIQLGLTSDSPGPNQHVQTSAIALSKWRVVNVTFKNGSTALQGMSAADALRVQSMPMYGFVPRFYRLMQNSSGSINYFMRFLPRNMDVRDARGVRDVADPRASHASRALIYISFIMCDYRDLRKAEVGARPERHIMPSLTGSPSREEIDHVLDGVRPVIDPQPPAEMEFVVTNLVQRFVHGIYNYLYLTRPWITITLYRGLIPTEALPAPEVGQEHIETGIMYATPSYRRVSFYVTRGSATVATGRGYLLEFANARVPCVYNYCDDAVYSLAGYSEEEFALPPGTRYVVTSLRRENDIDVYSCEFTNLDTGWAQQSYVPSTGSTPEEIRFGNSLYFENQQVCELVNSRTNRTLSEAFTKVDRFVNTILQSVRSNLDKVRNMHKFIASLGTKYTGAVDNQVFWSDHGIYAHMSLTGQISAPIEGWGKPDLHAVNAPVYLLQNPAAEFFVGGEQFEVPPTLGSGFVAALEAGRGAASGVMQQPLLRLAHDAAPPVLPGFGRRAKRTRESTAAAPVDRKQGATVATLDTFYSRSLADRGGPVIFATMNVQSEIRRRLRVRLQQDFKLFDFEKWKEWCEGLPIARAVIVCKDEGMVDHSGRECADLQLVVQMYTREVAITLDLDVPHDREFDSSDLEIYDFFESDFEAIDDEQNFTSNMEVLEFSTLGDAHQYACTGKGMSPFIYMLDTFMELRPGIASKTGCSLGAGGWVIDYIADQSKPGAARSVFVPRRRTIQAKLLFAPKSKAGEGLGAPSQQSRRSVGKRQARPTRKARAGTPRGAKPVRKEARRRVGIAQK